LEDNHQGAIWTKVGFILKPISSFSTTQKSYWSSWILIKISIHNSRRESCKLAQ